MLVGVSVWRLAIAACAFTGFGAAISQTGGFRAAMPGLSQLASLLTGLVYLGLLAYPLVGRRHEPESPWLRGAVAVLLMLVGITFMTLMGGDLDETWSLFEHLITPLVVLIDFLAVGRSRVAVKWWYPFSWLAFPLAYLAYFLIADVSLYGNFLDPDDSGFLGTLAGFLLAVIVGGYVLYGAAKLVSLCAISTANSHPVRRSGQGPAPEQDPAQPFPPRPSPPRWHPGQQGPPPHGQRQYPPGSYPGAGPPGR